MSEASGSNLALLDMAHGGFTTILETSGTTRTVHTAMQACVLGMAGAFKAVENEAPQSPGSRNVHHEDNGSAVSPGECPLSLAPDRSEWPGPKER